MTDLERGRQMLRRYLNSKNDCLYASTRNRLFRVFDDMYALEMRDFFFSEEVSNFLNKKSTAEEKEKFCLYMVRRILDTHDVKAEYKRRWPEDFA